MKYEDIQKVNSEIKAIDLKGKDYAMVPERVTAFRKLYPDGFIITDVISNDGTTVMMQAKAGFYKENGEAVVLGSGFAQEVKGKGMVNGTSHIENCETSAVGRALGFLGLGINGGGICSAEELVNAVVAQNQMQRENRQPEKPVEKPAAEKPAVVTVTDSVQAKKDQCKKALRQNAAFAYGAEAEARLNELFNNFGVTIDTMSGPIFKQINAMIMADIARKGAA